MPDPARRISVIEPHQFWIAAGAVSAKYVLEFMLMKTRLFSNQIEAHMTPFIGRFVGNVCTGMAASLKLPEKIRSLSYDVDGENILIKVNQESVPLNLSNGFSRVIILDTVRGMLHHLKMADLDGAIRIDIDLEAES